MLFFFHSFRVCSCLFLPVIIRIPIAVTPVDVDGGRRPALVSSAGPRRSFFFFSLSLSASIDGDREMILMMVAMMMMMVMMMMMMAAAAAATMSPVAPAAVAAAASAGRTRPCEGRPRP